jgi:uncharacterized protein
MVIVFAKAPVPGSVKTRLIPTLGADHAAMLHAALVERALLTATRSHTGVLLACTPSADEHFFLECAEDFGIKLTEQGEGDLGERMLRALNAALESHSGAGIVGADCPAVTAKHIDAAIDALSTHDVSIIPAEDGGYVLIAARRTHPAMFANIEWGTDAVMAQQRRALAAVGLSLHESAPLWDVDRPEDLPRLKALKPPLAYSWPD